MVQEPVNVKYSSWVFNQDLEAKAIVNKVFVNIMLPYNNY